MTSGLTHEEARVRLFQQGPNTITTQAVTRFAVFFRQLASPLTLMLIGAAIISLVLREFADAISVGAILTINVGLSFFQEYRSENALKDLQKFVAARARVRRDGVVSVVFREDIVTGDVVVLEPGDIIPADLEVLEAKGLLVDESVLTGESVALAKGKKAQLFSLLQQLLQQKAL